MYIGTHAVTRSDQPAVIRPAAGETLTYRELDARSNQVAHLLHSAGLRRGDHVSLFMENSLVYFEVLWACLRSGLYFTPINYHLSATEAAYIVDDSDARVLIASAALEQTAELGRMSPRCIVKLSSGGAVEGFGDYAAARDRWPRTPLPEERLGTMMLYSSGTTGRAKGIRRPLMDLPAEQGSPQIQFLVDLYHFDASSVYLSPAPLYHGAPTGFTSATLQAGGTVIVMDRFDAELALQLIERYRVTHSQWVPSMFIRMLRLDPVTRSRYDLSSQRFAIHAAAPCPVDVKRAMIDWWGPIIEEYYSSTESVGLTKIGSAEWLQHPGSVGRAYAKALHICDDAGNELPAGIPGLIYGETPTGDRIAYHKHPDETAGAAHPAHPEWMTVGDIGYLDADGYLYLTDRKSFMIISGGVNIYPQQIENALALHPKIADVAVIGVPNPDLGEEVKAVVQPAAGVVPSAELAQEILRFVTARLGRQLTPRSVDFVDELPRLATGKLYKKELRDRYWKDVASAAGIAAKY